jgi:hypothetical protein
MKVADDCDIGFFGREADLGLMWVFGNGLGC